METNAVELEARLNALVERARRARMRKKEREYPPFEEVAPVLAALVAAYRAGGDAERERMRSTCRHVVDVQTWLTWIAAAWAREIADAQGAELLENALAALSLEGGARDADETLDVVGIVWHRAHRAKLDPRAAFERAAGRSGTDAFADVLRDFERSEFHAEEIAPYLEAPVLPYETEE